MTARRLRTEDYQRAAELREAFRRFEHQTETIVPRHRLTPRRYLLLVAIRGAPDGRARATIGELAERLFLAQNTVSELIERMEEAGLVRRERAPHDARVVYVSLTRDGERRLAAALRDLADERERLEEIVRGLTND